MTDTVLTPDICVIGAGSGGLSLAAGAAAFGVEVVLVEKGRMGGDCLNYGCVPSKALLSSAKAAFARNGLVDEPLGPDFESARAHIQATIAAIAPHDSQERFEGLGVTVLRGGARFVDQETVSVGDRLIKARRFVVASGSSPLVPPIPGLDQTPYLTNETLFEDLRPKPDLLIIGGGPIGLEMAQAHRRLGSRVTVLEAGRILSKDDPEHVEILRQHVKSEGIALLEDTHVERVEPTDSGGVIVHVATEQGMRAVTGTHLLLAVGRSPNVDGLDLEKAGIATDKRGIRVDASLRTNNRKVYAIGDVAGGPQFTHAAGAQAGLLLRALLFRLPVKFTADSIPWATYTSPEVAHVGLGLEEARRRAGAVRVLSVAYDGNDRARTDNQTIGALKLYAGKGGRLLGADIIGAQAGELACLLSLAYSKKMTMRDLAGFVAPYPTLSELVRRAAISYYAEAPANPWVRRVVAILQKFG
ncbi:dihydrolipoyl dehydrogenase family protein [Roseibium sp.]|uniref:dihydrolipoyl dehydrogenase family protein n=1 Tax=Roseibium sp. TaxID=1936156 RepID=UPI003A97D7B4